MKSGTRYVVFDVESIGLYGEGFAVGWAAVRPEWSDEILETGMIACLPEKAFGDSEDRAWVKAHIPPLFESVDNPKRVRQVFWERWRAWQAEGAVLVADCGFPVEANFLRQCVEDDLVRRHFSPYPLHELATLVLANGGDPTATYERQESELPVHNPMKDAQQSARILLANLRKLKKA